jgi:hypothetical protein
MVICQCGSVVIRVDEVGERMAYMGEKRNT